ncbi:MAG: hypothetical protein ABIJ09_07435 [Pseudomonadota bacterium]
MPFSHCFNGASADKSYGVFNAEQGLAGRFNIGLSQAWERELVDLGDCDENAKVNGIHCSLLTRQHRLKVEWQLGSHCASGATSGEFTFNPQSDACDPALFTGELARALKTG